MSKEPKKYGGPAVGYGSVDGKHVVCLYAENCFLTTKTARELATDLLIWAERIDERDKAEEENEDGGGDE